MKLRDKGKWLALLLSGVMLLLVFGLIGNDYLTRMANKNLEEAKGQQAQAVSNQMVSVRVDTKKFEGVYRAAKSIESSTEVGVPYLKFGDLLRNLATEVSIADDKAKTKKEREVLGIYSEALTMYRDSYTLWRYKVEGAWVLSGRIMVDSAEIEHIVEKYNLHKIDEYPIADAIAKECGFSTTISENSFQVIWTLAHEKLGNLLF